MNRIMDASALLCLLLGAAAMSKAVLGLGAAQDVEALLLVAFSASLLWSSSTLIRARGREP